MTSKSTDVSTQVAPQGKLISRIAERYGVDGDKMLATLKQTAFRQRSKKDADNKFLPPVEVTNEQMMMLMVVADQYKLNPFTREIYAFPDDRGGIVPIVGVDGWIRIINERAELKSISFEYAPEGATDPWISCTIERHDRNKPTEIREYLGECMRATDPWRDMPKRMLRHKALIQCARVAFGFAGIYDPDEAERFDKAIDVTPPKNMKPVTRPPETIDPEQAT
jgi:phage recombination protein Bet